MGNDGVIRVIFGYRWAPWVGFRGLVLLPVAAVSWSVPFFVFWWRPNRRNVAPHGRNPSPPLLLTPGTPPETWEICSANTFGQVMSTRTPKKYDTYHGFRKPHKTKEHEFLTLF